MYNSMTAFPNIPYNIVKFLAKDEIIWKLLKYNDYHALSKPDLTFDEKMDLIWKEGPQEKYGVFLTNLVEDAIIKSKTILKIYSFDVSPETHVMSNAVYAFDILSGGQMDIVEYEGIPVNRGDLFINRILTDLNGSYVGGVGKMIFSKRLSNYCAARSVIGNSKTFTGKVLYLGVQIGDAGERTPCDT